MFLRAARPPKSGSLGSYISTPYADKRKLVRFLTGPESKKRLAPPPGTPADASVLPAQGVFCSEMCRHALNAAAFVDFVWDSYALNQPSPGMLSQSTLLADVPVRWHEAVLHPEPAYV